MFYFHKYPTIYFWHRQDDVTVTFIFSPTHWSTCSFSFQSPPTHRSTRLFFLQERVD